jgi:hypothetical protein
LMIRSSSFVLKPADQLWMDKDGLNLIFCDVYHLRWMTFSLVACDTLVDPPWSESISEKLRGLNSRFSREEKVHGIIQIGVFLQILFQPGHVLWRLISKHSSVLSKA